MILLIIIFAVLMLLAGVVIIIKPEVLFNFLGKNADTLGIHIGAVVVRLALGALLIYNSSVSKFPLIIEFIGWISVVAAIVFSVIGRDKFKRIMAWAISLLNPWGRMGGVLALFFGVFLIYAFV